MRRINLKSSNRKASIAATFLTILFVIISLVIPTLLINIIPESALGNYFVENIYYAYIIIPVLLYILITGFYYYHIKIDAYILYITSFRTLSGLLKSKDYIEIPHNILKKYSFFNRPYSANKTLMIKLDQDNGKKIIKRFNLSFLSKGEENRIRKVLDQIIAKNT